MLLSIFYMICYYHSDKEAVGTCPSCNKNLCKDCFDLIEGHLCYDCAQTLNSNVKATLKTAVIGCIVTVAAAIIAIILFTIEQSAQTNYLYYIALGIWFLACIVPAWKFLTWLANKMFGVRVYSGFMILIAFIIKLILAIFVAIAVPFVYIIFLIINLVNYNKVKKNMEIIDAHHEMFINI